MGMYKEERPSPDGRQITFTCSIHLIIEAMAPGDCIFDETGEIAALPWSLDAALKKYTSCDICRRSATRIDRARHI